MIFIFSAVPVHVPPELPSPELLTEPVAILTHLTPLYSYIPMTLPVSSNLIQIRSLGGSVLSFQISFLAMTITFFIVFQIRTN
jgi:hypothetical protein